jgi:DNA-directed RNA polymerase sigma subunit (sigma70/sigma32)
MHIDSKLDLEKILAVYQKPKSKMSEYMFNRTVTARKRSIEIFKMRVEGMKYVEIAKEIGLSADRIRQLEAKCNRDLKEIAIKLKLMKPLTVAVYA